MRRDLVRLTAAAVACLLLGFSVLGAEGPAEPPRTEPAKPVPAKAAPPALGGVEESQPSIYYLKDQQGRLQPVVNFTLPEFEELYKIKHFGEVDQRPRYSLQQMSASGTVTGGYAEMSIQFRILVRDEQWTRVPLRLDQGVLREPPQGAGEQLVEFEGGGSGYVAWIRGKAGQQHEITLKMLVPLATAGEETRLHLLVPRTTASDLKLKVPVAGAVAKVSEGATLRTPNNGPNDTELLVVGLGGDFELSWHRPEARVAGVPTVLEAQGSVTARLDNRGIEAVATLTVSSYGRSFDSFRIRLPQEAELVPGVSNGYTVVPVDTTGPAGARQRVVEVRLAKPTAKPCEVQLATNRAVEATKPGPWLDLAGFEVIGAARQWGTIAVSVVGDWQILWGPSAGVEQKDPLADPARRKDKDVVAVFDYLTQPCSLSARLVQRKTRIAVEPKYVLSVGAPVHPEANAVPPEANAVYLDATLSYTIRGGKVFALDIVMPGWHIDDIGPENLVVVDGVPKGAVGGTLSIPLVQPLTGPFVVRLHAHRPLAADAKSLTVPLPEPQASAPATADLAVLPADNVELIPNGDAMTGLFRQQGTIPMELPKRQQEPLFYRSEAKAVFAADFRRHACQISVDVASQVELDAPGGQVQQKLAYLISYAPTDNLTLEVPRRLAEPKQLELKCNGQAVAAEKSAPGDTRDDAAKPVRMRVALPANSIGPCELTIRYALAPRKNSQEKRAVVLVPLVMPAEGDLLSNRLRVTAASDLRVEPRPGPWTVEAGPPPAGQPRGLQLATAARAGQVELDVQGETRGEAAVVVQRAWVQTWLTQTARQDQAVFQFSSRRRELEIALPADAANDQVGAVLDGKNVAVAVTAENTVVLPLPGDGGVGRHLLELRYHFSDPRPPRGAMAIELPHPRGDAWVRQMYWQLVLPPSEHLVGAPADFTSESAWQWQGACWGRQPLLDQAQLEDWVGLSPDSQSCAPGDANFYLFSTLGSTSRAELRTASRSAIVLAASGAALLAGLLLIYWPRSRHPASLLTATAVLAAATALQPELALLAAQAAVLGLVLALLAGLLSHTLGRRRVTLPFSEPASALVGSSVLSARTQALPLAVGTAAPAGPPSPSTTPPESQA